MPTQAELNLIAKRNVCAECGANLVTGYFDGDWTVRCGKDKSHRGTRKIGSEIEQAVNHFTGDDEKLEALEILSRVEGERRMTTETEKRTLAQYEGKQTLSKVELEDVIKTLWPKAPAVEAKKALMLCQQYRLNPLAKHVYLIPFGQSFALVLGIGATRLIARRAALNQHINYGYEDFSPRIMTADEQMKINGKVDDKNVWAITILMDNKGNKVYGTGSWPAGKAVQGGDKGNTPENMARIRSERNALDRLLPGEITPMNQVDVVDESYMPTVTVTEPPQGQLDKVDTSTGEIVEGAASVVEEPEAPHPATTEPPASGKPAKSDPATINGIDVAWLKESLTALKWDKTDAMKWLAQKFGVMVGKSLTEMVGLLTPAQAKTFGEEIEDRLHMQ
jgi:hypothetical protein